MGGSPTLPNDANVSENPALQTPEQQAKLTENYARLNKQGMSDQGIVNDEDFRNEMVGTYRDLKGAIKTKIVNPLIETFTSPNPTGRDTSVSEYMKAMTYKKEPTKQRESSKVINNGLK